MRLLFCCFLSIFTPLIGVAHEFQADKIEIFDARADVLDGDTSTLFVQMTIANGAATTVLTEFETNRGSVGDWIEVRNVFGNERLRVMDSKTIRSETLYRMQRPDAYLIINNVDPSVYTCDFGYILVHVLFANGEGLDVAVWIDPVYVPECN